MDMISTGRSEIARTVPKISLTNKSRGTCSIQTNTILKEYTLNYKREREREGYLGVTTGHVLHHTARRQPPAARRREACSDAVHGDVNHSPNAFSMLLAEPEEVHFPDCNQRGENLQLRVHLNHVQNLEIRNQWLFVSESIKLVRVRLFGSQAEERRLWFHPRHRILLPSSWLLR